MASKANPYPNSNSKQKPFIISLLFLSLTFLVLTALSFHDPKPTNNPNHIFPTTRRLHHDDQDQDHDHDHHVIPVAKHPEWLNFIVAKLKKVGSKKSAIKVGLVNTDDGSLRGRHADVELVPIRVTFDSLAGTGRRWEEFFPEWIDEDGKWASPSCPEVPLPSSGEPQYDDLDVVVVESPCVNVTRGRGARDVFRLQVNLVAASLAARRSSGAHRAAYVVFLGPCGPMVEIFRCDDIVRQSRGEYWVYRPEMTRLKQKLLMPVGSCHLAPFYALPGKEPWRTLMSATTPPPARSSSSSHHSAGGRGLARAPRYAYATILHSSEAYVCGAVALAHSIRLANSTKPDLVLLADTASLSARSLAALRSAGWKIFPVHRIRSPFAAKGSYNEWNYSKLRVFQLARYHKVVFIDADLLVLRNLDHLFFLPGLAAAPNSGVLFNSGLMVVEPSACLFEDLMRRSFEVVPYNGGDQGFLNEVFTWWHRLPRKANYLKVFGAAHPIPRDVEAVHYLGLKPWTCYRDYDCNWDMADRHIFASDAAHRRWWEVYDAMPPGSKAACGLTKKMDWRIRKWRGIAKEKNLSDGHWRIKPKDPRRLHFVE